MRPKWNGIYEPKDITPEYIQSLELVEAVKLLLWMNSYGGSK